jgi:hypothetical protein
MVLHNPVPVCFVTFSTIGVWLEYPFQVPTMLAGQAGLAALAEAIVHAATIAVAEI